MRPKFIRYSFHIVFKPNIGISMPRQYVFIAAHQHENGAFFPERYRVRIDEGAFASVEIDSNDLEAAVDLAKVGRRNAQTVERLYQSERDRDLALWVTFWHPEGRQTFPTLGETATVAGIADLEAVTKEKFEVRPPYGIEAIVDPLTDPQMVLARLALDYPGQPIVHLWCLFHFNPDGLVVEVEEIFDRGPSA